jgi:hypothetical protein
MAAMTLDINHEFSGGREMVLERLLLIKEHFSKILHYSTM